MATTGLFGRVGEFHPERETLQSYVERMEMFFLANNILEESGEDQEAVKTVEKRKHAIFLTEIGSEATLTNLLVSICDVGLARELSR